MSQKVKSIWNAMTSILVFACIVLAFLTVGVKLFGVDTYIVLSGSMEPEIQTGSLIYVVEKTVEELEPGDIITFEVHGGMIVTHRISEIFNDGELGFITKGDANEIVDNMIVREPNIIGTPIFSMPHLGYLASYIHQPPGLYVAISMACLLVLMVFLPDFFNDKKEEEK